jgi:Flp pilus assembly protein TadD
VIESYPLLSVVLIGLAIRPLIVFLHELGHAFAAKRSFPQRVSIYLGSYGDKQKSANLEIGSLEIWFTSNPFLWQRGLCVPTHRLLTTRDNVMFILAGPLTPVIIAFIAVAAALLIPTNVYFREVIFIFAGVAVLDLIYDLIPNSKPVAVLDDQPVFNDGYALKLLSLQSRYPDEYFTALRQFENQEYEEATRNFEWAARRLPNEEIVHKNLAMCYRLANNFEALRKIYSEFDARNFSMTVDELQTAGFACSHLNDHTKAMEYYERILKIDHLNKYALNNKAFTLQLYGKLEESIEVLELALSADEKFDDAINNRGYARIKLGKVKDGLADINKALELNPDNSYAYRNLGIYHKMNGEYDKALAMFKRAREIDPMTYNIDLLIAEQS